MTAEFEKFRLGESDHPVEQFAEDSSAANQVRHLTRPEAVGVTAVLAVAALLEFGFIDSLVQNAHSVFG